MKDKYHLSLYRFKLLRHGVKELWIGIKGFCGYQEKPTITIWDYKSFMEENIKTGEFIVVTKSKKRHD